MHSHFNLVILLNDSLIFTISFLKLGENSLYKLLVVSNLSTFLSINKIDDFFKQADEQHKLVQQFYDMSQQKHEEYMKSVKELSVQISEANKKHEEYIEVRNEAQKNHEKAFEMRSMIVSIKGERRKRWDEAKKAIKEQNIKARKSVLDKEKLGEIADKSVDALKKGEKIKL